MNTLILSYYIFFSCVRELCILQVNTQLEGKGPVHLTIVEGFMSALKTIIKFRPDLEMEVSGYSGSHMTLNVCVVLSLPAVAKSFPPSPSIIPSFE